MKGLWATDISGDAGGTRVGPGTRVAPAEWHQGGTRVAPGAGAGKQAPAGW